MPFDSVWHFAGQIVMEGYLNLRISPWIRRLITRLIAVAPAVITILYFGEEKLGELLIFSQVILSLQLGFAIIPLIHFTGNAEIMGKFKNPNWVKVLAWLSAIVIIGLNIKLVNEEVGSFLETSYANSFWLKSLIFTGLFFTAILLIYVLISPLIVGQKTKVLVPHHPLKKLSIGKPKKFTRIAITVDFSLQDETSIQHAISMGDKNTMYFLIHIVESAAAKRHGEDVNDIESMQDLLWIQTYANELSSNGIQVQYKLGYGNRANNIAQMVADLNIELLVMGAHGHEGLKDIIFGSTVNSVRHKVKIPVLVVR